MSKCATLPSGEYASGVSDDVNRRGSAAAEASSRCVAASTAADATRTPGAALVTARGVTVELGGRPVLRDVSLEVRAGDVVALLGRNGAGKTTLLRALGGLLRPTRGSVDATVPVGCVPQNPNALLFAPTVRAELRETLRLVGRPDDAAVDHWLDALGLLPHADRHPRSLSGGERQRVAIAAVAVGGAPVLLLDEPTRGMDAAARRSLAAAVGSLTNGGSAVVLATHDAELAAELADRTISLRDGRAVEAAVETAAAAPPRAAVLELSR